MRAIIWRNRASAILGFLVVVVAFLEGLPQGFKTVVLVLLGLAIMVFGLSRGRNRDYSYKIEETTEVTVDRNS